MKVWDATGRELDVDPVDAKEIAANGGSLDGPPEAKTPEEGGKVATGDEVVEEAVEETKKTSSKKK